MTIILTRSRDLLVNGRFLSQDYVIKFIKIQHAATITTRSNRSILSPISLYSSFPRARFTSLCSKATNIYSRQNLNEAHARSNHRIRMFHSSNPVYANKRDYYDVLGLGRSSSKDEIKKKYRELAKKYHPDLNKDDKSAEDKFKEINEAYEILSDDKKKQMYDSYGHQGVDPNMSNGGGNPFAQGGPFGGFGGFGGAGGGFEFRSSGNVDAEDLFEMFGIRMRPSNKGKDVQLSIRLSFLEGKATLAH
jgi:hypothetical protein